MLRNSISNSIEDNNINWTIQKEKDRSPIVKQYAKGSIERKENTHHELGNQT